MNYDFYIANTGKGGGGEGLLLWHLSFDALPLYGASFRLLPFIFTPRPTPSYASPYLLSQRIRQVPHIQKKSGQDHCLIFYLLIITITTIIITIKKFSDLIGYQLS